jgi:DNA invertase Pin-like site-specific DNA recombinase
MTKTAVGYTRLSQESDTSIERQTTHIQEYADEQGWTLTTIYDEGQRASGFDTDREKYEWLLTDLRSGAVDVLVTNDKRRLARDVDEVMRLVPDLREHGVEYHTHQDGHIDLSDPIRAAIEIVSAAAAHEEKLAEIEKAKQAVDERLSNGYDHGRPPTGFRFDDDGQFWVPDRGGEFERVIEAIEMVDDGATYEAVEDELGISPGTMTGILDRREMYEKHRTEGMER